MDKASHEAKDATRSLKLRQRRPHLIELLEDFRMDRVTRLEPTKVRPITDFRRELLRVLRVDVCERTASLVPIALVLDGAEETATNDLEGLIGADGLPHRFDATEVLFDGSEHLAGSLVADLH